MHLHTLKVMELFDKTAPDFGEKGCSYFGYFGERLALHANIGKNDQVLDVATGKGSALLAAERRLGIGGSITGVDISREMLNELRKRAPARVKLLQMDAENLNFPPHSFDVVCCACALYFFPDLAKGLSEFKRVLKPGGRLAVSTFRQNPSSLSFWTKARAIEMGASEDLRITALDSADALAKTLSDAGFSNVKIISETKEFWFENFEDWWASLWTHGLRAVIETLSPQKQQLLRQKAFQYARDNNWLPRIKYDCPFLFGLAQAPKK